MMTSPYIHATHGRLRIKIPEIKRAPARASKIEADLLGLRGVTSARANLLTGSLIILFDSTATNHQQILKTLKGLGCFKVRRKLNQPDNVLHNQFGAMLTKLLLQTAIEVALNHLVALLI